MLHFGESLRYFFPCVGLEPGTRYYYNCGDSSIPAMSQENSFETFAKPSPKNYPARIAVIGDLGLTSNSSTTVDHLSYNDPSMILMIGDLTYANQYLTTGGKGASCFSCAFPDAPIRETYQPRWDGWGR
jgi:acid phosphatase type 7